MRGGEVAPQVTDQLATMDHIRENCTPGDFVSIPIRITLCQETETWEGAECLA